MTTTHSTQSGIDTISPVTHPARDGSGFRAIRAAAKDLERAQSELRDAVDQARANGDSWTIIGTALGISKQAAQQRFGG